MVAYQVTAVLDICYLDLLTHKERFGGEASSVVVKQLNFYLHEGQIAYTYQLNLFLSVLKIVID